MSTLDLLLDDYGLHRLGDLWRQKHAPAHPCKRCGVSITTGIASKLYCAGCSKRVHYEAVEASKRKRMHPCAENCGAMVLPQNQRCDPCARRNRRKVVA